MLKNSEGDERKSFVVTLTNLQQTCEKCAKLSQDGGKSAEFEKERKAFAGVFFKDNGWPVIEEIKETAERKESLNDFFKERETFTINKKAFIEFTGKLCKYAKAIAGEDKVQQKIDEMNNKVDEINKKSSKKKEQEKKQTEKKIDNGTPKSKKDNACCIVF